MLYTIGTFDQFDMERCRYNVDGELYYAVGENFKMTDACWETANCAHCRPSIRSLV